MPMADGRWPGGGTVRRRRMGVVCRAKDVTLDRAVALKVLSDGATADSRRRFRHEVQLVAGLDHPHVVALYAAGEEQGHAFAAMS